MAVLPHTDTAEIDELIASGNQQFQRRGAAGMAILDDELLNNEQVLGEEFQKEIAESRALFGQNSFKSDETDKMLEVTPEHQQSPTPKIVQKK